MKCESYIILIDFKEDRFPFVRSIEVNQTPNDLQKALKHLLESDGFTKLLLDSNLEPENDILKLYINIYYGVTKLWYLGACARRNNHVELSIQSKINNHSINSTPESKFADFLCLKFDSVNIDELIYASYAV